MNLDIIPSVSGESADISRVQLVLVLFAFVALISGRVTAQSSHEDAEDALDRQSEQIEEITVLGQKRPGALRIEVQNARERVYDLFNSMNSNDKFDIHCRNVSSTGSRISRRVCRPQYADAVTGEAGQDFLLGIRSKCPTGVIETDACLNAGFSRAQGTLSELTVRDRELGREVQRLAKESPEFRRAIAEYQVLERRYEEARGIEQGAVRASASIVDTAASALRSLRSTRDDTQVPPEAVDLSTPEVPSDSLGARREGWVKLRYSVLADGSSANTRVIDALPSGLDTSGAVDAVRAWTFVPATADGVPVDWHDSVAVIAFNREETGVEASPAFAEAYEEVARLRPASTTDVRSCSTSVCKPRRHRASTRWRSPRCSSLR